MANAPTLALPGTSSRCTRRFCDGCVDEFEQGADSPTAIPIKRASIVFRTWFACFVGSRYGKRSKSAVVYGGPVRRRGVARRIVSGRWNISLPSRPCVRDGDRPVRNALHARPAIERGGARACERWL